MTELRGGSKAVMVSTWREKGRRPHTESYRRDRKSTHRSQRATGQKGNGGTTPRVRGRWLRIVRAPSAVPPRRGRQNHSRRHSTGSPRVSVCSPVVRRPEGAAGSPTACARRSTRACMQYVRSLARLLPRTGVHRAGEGRGGACGVPAPLERASAGRASDCARRACRPVGSAARGSRRRHRASR